MAERPLNCTIRIPQILTIPDTKSEFNSGCKVIDVSLSNTVNPENRPKSKTLNRTKFEDDTSDVGEIHFKNNYAAYLSVKVKCRVTDGKEGSEVRWRTCVKKMRLMPNPHVESGAQDYFIISRKHMLFELVNVMALRIIMQQPSPVWKEFKIEDLKIFRSSETVKPNVLPAWLTDPTDLTRKNKVECEDGDRFPPQIVHKDTDIMETLDQEGISNLEALSSNLQQLWALSEEVAAHQTSKALGRYEVDGCYDINLLSYT